MIGEHDFNRLAEHAAAGIFHRHAGGRDRAGTAEIGVKTGLVVEHADPDHVIGDLRLRSRGFEAGSGQGCH
jgi:hypothetical protein